MDCNWPSGAQVTDFFFLPSLVRPVVCGGVLAEVGGGVETAGDSFRALAIDLRASWNGSIDEGCATFGSSSFFICVVGAGAFLKLGSLGFGLGAEKNEESDLASFTAVTTGFASFFTIGLDDDAVPTAAFFGGGMAFDGGGSLGFRFLVFESMKVEIVSFQRRSRQNQMTCLTLCCITVGQL